MRAVQCASVDVQVILSRDAIIASCLLYRVPSPANNTAFFTLTLPRPIAHLLQVVAIAEPLTLS